MLKPLNDNVLVKIIKPENRTKAGLFIPEQASDAHQKGQVISIGDGYINADGAYVPLAVDPGDIVLFRPNTGISVPLGDGYVVLQEKMILGILENSQ